MGTMRAMGMAEAVADGDISLDQALGYHLQVNHYPPIPGEMVEVCKKAIELANQGDWDAEVFLPDGITYRDQLTAPVAAIVEAHHLHTFLED